MNMVHQPEPVCGGYGAEHTTASCQLAFTNVIEPKEVNYA